MGYLFLFLSKIAAIIKMISVKNCGNIASGARNSVLINLIRAIGCITVSLAVCLVSGFGKMDTIGLIISIFSGVSMGASLFTWVLVATKVSLCTVETFCMAGGVVLPLIVAPFVIEGESVSIAQWVGSAILFVAMFCLSKGNKKTKLDGISLILLLVCGFANFGCVFTKKLFTTFSKGNAEDYQLYTFIFVFLTLIAIFLFFPKKKTVDSPKFTSKVVLYIALAIIMLYLVEYLATLSSNYLSSAIYYPLSYIISMPLTFLADIAIYKEKITVNNIFGIVLVTLSGVLINF